MATKLRNVEMFAGNRVIQRFNIADLIVDPTGATPMELFGRSVKWSLSMKTGAGYSDDPLVDKNSDDSADVKAELSELTVATVNFGGTGYAVGDVLLLVGGVGVPAAVTVTSAPGGVVDGVSIKYAGVYSTAPLSATVAAKGGNGTCQLNTTFAPIPGAVLVTMVEADTQDLGGRTTHQELEVFDSNGAGLVVAVGDVKIAVNVLNA